MKIGLFSDGLPDLSFTDFLDWSVYHGIEAVEIGTGGFSSSPHCDLDGMLTDEGAIGVASKPASEPNETETATMAAKSTAGKELLEDLSKCTGTLEEAPSH